MITINVIPTEKPDRNITMSSSCAEVLKCLMKHKEEWFNKTLISEETDLNMRDVTASLIGLQKIGLVRMERDEDYKSLYQFIPQDEKIKFKIKY